MVSHWKINMQRDSHIWEEDVLTKKSNLILADNGHLSAVECTTKRYKV